MSIINVQIHGLFLANFFQRPQMAGWEVIYSFSFPYLLYLGLLAFSFISKFHEKGKKTILMENINIIQEKQLYLFLIKMPTNKKSKNLSFLVFTITIAIANKNTSFHFLPILDGFELGETLGNGGQSGLSWGQVFRPPLIISPCLSSAQSILGSIQENIHKNYPTIWLVMQLEQ